MKLIQYHSLVEDVTRETGRMETEEELIKEIKNIKNRLENSKLAAYHTIGTKIKGFYGKNYGKNEMAKIAKTIDLSKSTVYKIVQFAEKYNYEDIEEISGGAFQLSWHRLRDNLSLQREDVLRVYRGSHSIAEFHRKIKQIKRISKSGQEPEHDKKISEEDDQFCPGVLNLPAQDSNKAPSEMVKNLQVEITKLQSELEQKNHQLDSLRRFITKRKSEWITSFPELLQDLDNEALMRLESSLFEEIKRRETEKNKEEPVIYNAD